MVLNAQGTPAITLGVNEVPEAGIDVGGNIYVIFATGNNNPMPVTGNLGSSTRCVLATSTDNGNTYHYLYDFSTPPRRFPRSRSAASLRPCNMPA